MMYCISACSFGETPCKEGQCIRNEWICDGHVDCLQGTDEANCSMYSLLNIENN